MLLETIHSRSSSVSMGVTWLPECVQGAQRLRLMILKTVCRNVWWAINFISQRAQENEKIVLFVFALSCVCVSWYMIIFIKRIEETGSGS
jgi:hypothetical protein